MRSIPRYGIHVRSDRYVDNLETVVQTSNKLESPIFLRINGIISHDIRHVQYTTMQK